MKYAFKNTYKPFYCTAIELYLALRKKSERRMSEQGESDVEMYESTKYPKPKNPNLQNVKRVKLRI